MLEEEVKECFKNSFHTSFVSLDEKDNDIIVVRGTNMWSPGLIYAISEVIDGRAYRICYENHKWTAHFQKRKRTLEEIVKNK